VFRQLCADAGLGEGWQPRELRHTFVSLLSHAGVPVESIADAAGHTNANITRSVYRHQLADQVTVAATAMDAMFPGR
jgi:integrase